MSGRGPWGTRVLAYAFLAAFFLLVVAGARLQVVIGEDLAMRARDQRAERLATLPCRGAILDRHLRPLAGASYYRRAVVVLPQVVRDRVAVAGLVALSLGIPEERALQRLDSPSPLHLAPGDSLLEGAPDSALSDPGVIVVEEPARYSPEAIAAHVIGYTDPAAMRGLSGVEQLLDAHLRGEGQGFVAAFVDGRGRFVPGIGIRHVEPASEGADVRLAIDRDIQSVVERVMDAHVERGAVVVMDPRTGDVLALASRPTFWPGAVSSSLAEPGSPLVNRAIAAYPLGSVFKVVVAAAAIEGGLAGLHERLYDPGYVDVGTRRVRCYTYDYGGHGEITFLDAMAHSCNTAFVKVGARVGADALVGLAEALGFGATTGIGLPGEDPGVLPDALTVTPQDLANLSIGQGRLSGSPLQVAAMMSAIASGGRLRRPRLVMEIRPGGGSHEPRVFRPSAPVQVLKPDTCRQITFMLEAVTRWGTGTSAWVDDVGSCGKTGSAETGRFSESGEPVCHAWFAGFTPLAQPRLVIVVFVEEGISGGKAAAPIFAEIAEGALPFAPAGS